MKINILELNRNAMNGCPVHYASSDFFQCDKLDTTYWAVHPGCNEIHRYPVTEQREDHDRT